MSTTQRLPMLTPWRTLHRMWIHFATRWELPTKGEAAYTRGVKAGEHVAEEKMRAWYRTAFEAGYKQASEDLPLCHVQPAPLPLPPPPLGARARAALHRPRFEPLPGPYEPPEKRTGPISDANWLLHSEPIEPIPSAFDQLLDVPTVHDLQAVREKHEGRGKAS